MKTTLMLICAFWMAGLANAAALPDYPFLFETGTAQIELAPDMALVHITIADRGKDASRVFSAVNSSVDAVLGALARANVPPADIDASDIQRSVDYVRPEQRSATTVRYVITRQVKVRLRDLSAWPVLMADLAKISAIDTMSSDFQISSRQKVDLELEQQAARDAETRARRNAGYFGRKLGAVMAISRVPFDSLEQTFTGGSGNSRFMPPPFIPPMEPGSSLHVPAKISLSGSVNVLFRLE